MHCHVQYLSYTIPCPNHCQHLNCFVGMGFYPPGDNVASYMIGEGEGEGMNLNI